MINSVSRRGPHQILLPTFSRPNTAFQQLMSPFQAARRRNLGLRNVIPAQVTTMIAAPGRRGAAASCRGRPPKSLKTPGTAPALSAGTRYPHTASRWRTALPAKPARQRPADPDRPAMYPGGTWHPPPVDLRRHRASPSDHADASNAALAGRRHDGCRLSAAWQQVPRHLRPRGAGLIIVHCGACRRTVAHHAVISARRAASSFVGMCAETVPGARAPAARRYAGW